MNFCTNLIEKEDNFLKFFELFKPLIYRTLDKTVRKFDLQSFFIVA